ncbi:Fc.00g093640.m01.CDS01 [Cosmosporella sp. VM-42]
MPVQASGVQGSEPNTEQIASAIQQSMYERTHLDDHDGRDNGPLKDIIAHSDSLYKYISWEDPLRTLGSYIGALSILFGAHYLPLTQFALKAGATTLGVISMTELANRQFSPDTFLSRLRPKEYKKVPEPTLNATLKDIHDFVQFAVVQVQKILYGQDLSKTFAAFVGLAALFILIKVISPFGLALLGLTTLYIVPLIISPRGREVVHDVGARAEELGKKAAEDGSALAQAGKAKAMELSSQGQKAAMNTQRHVEDLSQSGKQFVIDQSTHARNTATDVFDATAQNFKLPDVGMNVINTTSGTGKSILSDQEQYSNVSFPAPSKQPVNGNKSISGGSLSAAPPDELRNQYYEAGQPGH